MRNEDGFWTAPRLWPGGDCFILGGGPSLSGVDLSVLKGRRVISVNNAYQLGDWDVLYWGDCRWLLWHRDEVLSWPGLRVTTCLHQKNLPWVRVLRWVRRENGITTDPGELRWNLSSGACAINLAVHFGVKRIVLLGYDMRVVDGKNNWHEGHSRDVGPKVNRYSRFLLPFEKIAADLERIDVECLNATPGSALTVFPIVELRDALR